MSEASKIPKKNERSLHRGQRATIGAIRLYQKTISPDHGVLSGKEYTGCRYYPSCSEYTARAISEHGVTKGVAYGAWRIARCNPFSPGGVDEPPVRRGKKSPKAELFKRNKIVTEPR